MFADNQHGLQVLVETHRMLQSLTVDQHFNSMIYGAKRSATRASTPTGIPQQKMVKKIVNIFVFLNKLLSISASNINVVDPYVFYFICDIFL